MVEIDEYGQIVEDDEDSVDDVKTNEYGELINQDVNHAEQLAEDEMNKIKNAENVLEKMIEEEEEALNEKKDAIEDLKKALAYFRKIEKELSDIDKIHQTMHLAEKSTSDLNQEERDTLKRVIEEGDDIQQKLSGVLKLIDDAQSDIKGVGKIQDAEKKRSRKEMESFQKQHQEVEELLTTIQDVRKLYREQT